jgi:hypothetical protein
MMLQIAAKIAGYITGGLVDKVLEAYKIHKANKTSEAEFESRVRMVAQETAAKVEQSWAQAATEATKAAHASLSSSPVLQRAWAVTLFLQVAVLVWYQVGASAFQVATGVVWPDPGISLEWAYLLVATVLGAGPLVLRRQGLGKP